MDDIKFVEQGSEEWNKMWDDLLKETGDTDHMMQHNESGEVWQYMGTYKGEHQFRHRHHPKTNKREYRNIKA